MTSVRRRKMNRSSVPKNTRKNKDKQRKINIHSNPIIAANWDPKLTLKQNYDKMGLRMTLGASPGGNEKHVPTLTELQQQRKEQNNSSSVREVEQTNDPNKIPEGEARIVRDPETGGVKEIIYGRMKESNQGDHGEKNEVVKQLEEYAETKAPAPKERKPSQRENEWLQQLYEKYGDDYDRMVWDKKLNVYQHTAVQLKKKILHWKKFNQI